jgi:murein DD-endopeptidase MepM/ murein hydrolase activator NlpD
MNPHEAQPGRHDAPPPVAGAALTRRGMLIGSAVAGMLAGLSFPLPAAAAGVVWGHPFSAYRNLNWGYGPRDGKMHHGIDYPLAGTARPSIHSVADGTVFDQGWHANFGNFVEIRHSNGWSSYYAHMLSPSPLRRSNTVKRGDVVGVMGNSGAASKGDHLHIELRTTPGVWNATTDPQPHIHRALLPHQASPSPSLPLEEDSMIALKIANGSAAYFAILGPGIFRSLIPSDDPDRVKNIVRIQDDWQTIQLSELPIYLRTYGCDLNIYEVRNGALVVRDPLTGLVGPGNVWTATGEVRAALARL